MLAIGQTVYTVNKLWIAKDSFKIYISKKEINKIERKKDSSIIYTAGKFNEIKFHQTENGDYQTCDSKQKAVYLDREAAEK